MGTSIHTARWINQLHGQGWDIHLFSVEPGGIHPELRDVTVHDFMAYRAPGLHPSIRLSGAWPLPRGAELAGRVLKRIAPRSGERSLRLARTIRRLQPDIVHSLEMQHAAYLTLEARNRYRDGFPTWIVSNWGNDIYLFGRLPGHPEKIKAVLAAADYYACECRRDVQLARTFGFRGGYFPVQPNAGGFHLERLRDLRQPGPVSSRRCIMVKGYQGWGRALVALRAIELCADVLEGYRILLYNAQDEDVGTAAALLSQDTGLPIEIIPHCSHEEILRYHGRARVSIGLSITDGVSTSFLEALVMGSFPIQSYTACADEWITHGESGFIVHPDDPEAVAAAIRRAITDDALVDRAAEINARAAAEKLDYGKIRSRVISTYEQVALHRRTLPVAETVREGLGS